MEIIALLKQVPSTDADVEIAKNGKSMKKDNINWVMNPYDEIAVEEALLVKEKHGGTVTVISLGGKKAEEGIRTAYAMGVDKGVFIEDNDDGQRDALGTASILAEAIKPLSPDLIIAGQRAVDDDNFQVGAAVAEFLDIPSISLVFQQTISDGTITCEKTIDGGSAKIQAKLPALITTQRGLNTPRYTSLKGLMKAKKKSIEKKSVAEFQVDTSSKVKILRMQFPPERKGGIIIDGATVDEKVAKLVNALHNDKEVI